MATLSRTLDILVVGAGQTGLALGYHLKTTLFTFQIVDCHRWIGDSWRKRYDSLVLFTPWAYSALPGLAVPGTPKAAVMSASSISCALPWLSPSSSRIRRMGRDQTDADGIERGLGTALHTQLREDFAHVRLNGLLGIVQAVGDLLVGLPLGQQPQHFGLACGERFGTLRGTHCLHQPRCGFGRQLDLPGCCRFDRLA